MSAEWDRIRAKRTVRESTRLNELAAVKALNADLLDALEEMVETFHGYQGMELTKARAAIAKARP